MGQGMPQSAPQPGQGMQGMPQGAPQPGQGMQGMPQRAPQPGQGMQGMPQRAPQVAGPQGMPQYAGPGGPQRRNMGRPPQKKKSYAAGPYIGMLGIFLVMGADAFAKLTILIVAYLLLVVINPGGMSGVTIDNRVLIMEKMGLRDSVYNTDLGKNLKDYKDMKVPEKATYTVMVYMIGTDLETGMSAGTKDIEEMINAELDDDVQVLIYAGGTTGWNNEVLSPAKHHICLVNNQGFSVVESRDRVNMANPTVLSDFIEMGMKDYPADHYGLILWDHGNGPVVGYGYPSDVEEDDITMSLAELDQAFSIGFDGQKVDFIGFDACLMGSVETVQMVSEYTDCMIASPETTYGTGWYYTPFLSHLSDHKYDSVFVIADRVISAYNESIFGEEDGFNPLHPNTKDETETEAESESFPDGDDQGPLTVQQAMDNYTGILTDMMGRKNTNVVMAVYDCRKIHDAIDALDALTVRIREDYNDEQIANRAGVVKQYDSPDMIDAGMWALMYFPEYPEAEVYYDRVTDVVYDHSASVDVGYCCGISQYLPTNENSYEDYKEHYDDFILYDWGSEEYHTMVGDIIDFYEKPAASKPGLSELWSSMVDLYHAEQNEKENASETESGSETETETEENISMGN